jgi:outer membrane cobalamin receptor
MTVKSVKAGVLSGASLAVIVVAAATPSQASAQLAAPLSAKDATSAASAGVGPAGAVEEVTVTATRVERQGYSALTPVSIIGCDQIQQQARENIADLINKIPGLFGFLKPGTVNGSVATMLGQNLLNLRGLGANRTLVLANGQLITPTTITRNVDINTLPSVLIKQVDVVIGGASAEWGSDAVAGVVNLIYPPKRKWNQRLHLRRARPTI